MNDDDEELDYELEDAFRGDDDLHEEEDDQDSEDESPEDAAMRDHEEEIERRKDEKHFANIADDLDQYRLHEFAMELDRLIDLDIDARKDRDNQYEEGIKRTGMGKEAPGGAQFDGASKVVHPMLTEVAIDFAARFIKEIFPPNGPVKTKIVGKANDKDLDKAQRKCDYMNWQCTEQMTELRSELEQLATQVALAGSQFLKVYWNNDKKRPESIYIPIDDIYLPYSASSFYSADRKTHRQELTEMQLKRRIRSGMYRDITLGEPSQIDNSGPQEATNKIEGKSTTITNEDGIRVIYEVYTFADLEEEDEYYPYIITIDESSHEVLAVYRNWDPDDEMRLELDHIIEFPFVPWRGAFSIGAIHMIGGLSASSTGALRALLDSAHINTIPSGLKLKGKTSGQNLNPQPGQIMDIEAPPNVDDIRQIFMAMPFNQPSPVLFELLGFLVNAGKGVVQTAFESLSDQNPNQPVGTTLALIEQGMVVFSAIHSRMHAAMARFLKVLHRINSYNLTTEDIEHQTGKDLVKPEDFDGPMDIIPVSDPNIFSEVQRLAQIQAVIQRSAVVPQLYKQRKVEERLLNQLKIPNPEELLVPDLKPEDMDPISENVAASMQRPIAVFPHQDHRAHIATHTAFIESQAFGMNPLIAPIALPILLNHLKDHMLQYYLVEAHKSIKDAEANQLIDGQDNAQQVAVAIKELQSIEQEFSSMPQIIGKAMQALQQFSQQQQPQDPKAATDMQIADKNNQASMQEKQMELQDKQQQRQIDAQAEQQKVARDDQLARQDAQLKQEQINADNQNVQFRELHEDQRDENDLQARLYMNEQDNATAKQLAEMEIVTGEKVNLSNGTGINPNP